MLAVRFDLTIPTGTDQPDLAAGIDAAVDGLASDGFVEKLWRRDHTAFGPDPSECADRMGWIDVVAESADRWDDLRAHAEAIGAWADHVVLMGMGGSSLFPEVLAKTFGSTTGAPTLHVLDSTHPEAVERVAAACPPGRTFHLVASKSGSTLETRSHEAFFRARDADPRHFGVITDPGSALGADARAAGYAEVFENRPDIGGRFSALSLFGMVPAALIGVDGVSLLDGGLDQLDALEPVGPDDELNVGLRLGAAMAVAARTGRDKLTFHIDPRLDGFGAWVEQLIAESTGKHGVGVVPVVGESPSVGAAHPADRLLVVIGDIDVTAFAAVEVPRITIPVEDATDLGALVVLWEFATAVCGRVLGINPFDQPDVESAKHETRGLLAGGRSGEVALSDVRRLTEQVRAGDHLALCAFVDPAGGSVDGIGRERVRLGRDLGVATTLGIGPRFLHSTGQLHKGGPASIVCLQFLEGIDAGRDVEIPGQPFTFGELFRAQADGDLAALEAAGRRSARVPLDDLT